MAPPGSAFCFNGDFDFATQPCSKANFSKERAFKASLSYQKERKHPTGEEGGGGRVDYCFLCTCLASSLPADPLPPPSRRCCRGLHWSRPLFFHSPDHVAPFDMRVQLTGKCCVQHPLEVVVGATSDTFWRAVSSQDLLLTPRHPGGGVTRLRP